MVLPIDKVIMISARAYKRLTPSRLRLARGVAISLVGSLCLATPVGMATNQPKLTPKTFARFSLNDSKEFKCLDILWTRESNWRHKAHNKAGGAYGIPQIKNKRVANLSPYQQINWGLRYIEHRYGTPCKALAFWDIRKWY